MKTLLIIYIILSLISAIAFAVEWKRGNLKELSTLQKSISVLFLLVFGGLNLIGYGIINLVKKIKAIKWKKK